MNKAYKFRIYPKKKQQVLFAKTFGCVRFLYNRMLSDKIEYYKETKQKLNNTPAQYKKEFIWLKEVDSLALANAQRHLETAYNNFFRVPKAGFPKFKSKRKNKKSYTTNCVNGNIQICNGYIKLPKIGLVKCKQHRKIPSDYKLKAATISQTASGKYYVSILFEYENQIRLIEPQTFLGLDFSKKELYKDSNGKEPCYPEYYRVLEQKLKREQRKFLLMQKDSKNRKKQRIKVAKLHEKIANQRKDFLQKQSKQIANAYDCVFIENFNMRTMSQHLKPGESLSDSGWGIFTKLLKYKLEDRGKQLVKVDEFLERCPICNVCRYKNFEANNSSIQIGDCSKCGSHHDRDVNAAINIRNDGMRMILASS